MGELHLMISAMLGGGLFITKHCISTIKLRATDAALRWLIRPSICKYVYHLQCKILGLIPFRGSIPTAELYSGILSVVPVTMGRITFQISFSFVSQ